jgi:methylmalonyl-CoA/ethylmalonyl-CoA epimerase
MTSARPGNRPPPRNVAANACTVQRLHHVGIAVKSLEETVARFRTLFGLPEPAVMESKERGIRAAVMNAGGTNLEFLQPMSKKSPFTQFIVQHGEGIHHICFAVESAAGARDHLQKHGVKLTNTEPVAGFNGHYVFTDPASTGGVRIELSQLYPEKADS